MFLPWISVHFVNYYYERCYLNKASYFIEIKQLFENTLNNAYTLMSHNIRTIFRFVPVLSLDQPRPAEAWIQPDHTGSFRGLPEGTFGVWHQDVGSRSVKRCQMWVGAAKDKHGSIP